VGTSIDINGLSIDDLFSIAQYVFLKEDHAAALGTVVSPPRITIREKVYRIAEFIRQQRTGYFHELISTRKERLEIVVTFLALLELIKRQMIVASQERIFRDIKIEPGEIWDENLMFELEFGE
jgi:segregation and condensation protein A